MANRSLFGITREKLEGLTTCSLCFEGYNKDERPAKFLPCLHSFCLICLNQHVHGERVFNCPLCRRSTNVPKSGVCGFPDNFVVENLTDLKPVVNADPTKVLRCGSCTDGETTAAVGFCYICQVFLCRTCEEAHTRMRAFNDHVVRTMEQLQNPSKLPQQVYCDQHKQERLTLFCSDPQCQKVLCLLCAHTRHQGHPTIELAERSSEVMREMKNLVEQARRKTELVRDISGKIKTEINRTSRLNEESTNAVTQFFGALQKKLNERMTNANAFQNQMCTKRTGLLRSQTDLAESLVSQFESACQFAETACGTGNPVNLIWARDQVCARLVELINLDLAQHIPFKPTACDVFKSFTADQEWALGEFEKIFQLLGIFTVSICNYDFEVDFPRGRTSSLITKALQVVRLRLPDTPGQSLENVFGQIDAFLVSPDGNSTDCGISRTSDTDVDGFEIQFQPMESGTHKLNIRVSGEPIKCSPFSLQVTDSLPPEPADAEKEVSSDVTWSPDVFARCEHTIFVKLHGIRECQRLTARYGMQDQRANGPENNLDDEPLQDVSDQDGETEARILSDGGTFRVVFTPPRAGMLIMTIFLDGRPIRKHPFLVSVSPLHPDSTEIHCAQMGGHVGHVAVLHMPYSIVISMHNYQGNRLHTRGHGIIASIATETSHQIQSVVLDNNNGSYSIEFTPRSLDPHTVDISVCGHRLKSNPTSVDVSRYLPFENPSRGYIRPTGIAIDKEKNIVLVADGRQSFIHRLESSGRSALEPIAISTTKRSVQIAISKLGQLVMLVPAQNSVVLLTASTGQGEQRWSCASETTTPTNVFFSEHGKVIICDCQSQKLFVYEMQGRLISHIQLPEGSLTGGCMNNACCLPNNDVIIATNRHPYRILRYTISGERKTVSASPANDDQLAVTSIEDATIVVSSIGKVMILALNRNGSSSVISEFATERIYTSLRSTGDGCFMAFDPGEGFHLDKYSHRGDQDDYEVIEVLV